MLEKSPVHDVHDNNMLAGTTMPSSKQYLTEIVELSESHRDNPARISPKEFLAWAEKDLAAGDKRGRGNALSNVKKALHSRLDELIAKTHVRFTRDWKPRWVTTDQKLDILRELGIQHEAIIDVLTFIRNKYEHAYVLPELRIVRSHLHAAQLWLEKSYSAYEFHPIGFANLPLLGISSGARRSNGSTVCLVKFGDPQQVLFFWNSKKQLLKIGCDGVEERQNYKSFDTKEMIKLEAPYIRRSFVGGSSVAVNQASLTYLLKRYRRWLKDYYLREGQGAPPNNGSATPSGTTGVMAGPASMS